MSFNSTISFADPVASPFQTQSTDTHCTYEKGGKWMFEEQDSSTSNRLVYGGLITDLRGDVREFYGIEGNDNRDCFAGCCDPCSTLTRVENEIMGRERIRKPSDACGYTPHPPMSSSSSSSRSSPDTEHDECLPCIPEDQSELSPSTPNSRRGSKKRERSIALDPVAPTDATLVHNHDIGRDPTGPTFHIHGNHSLSRDRTIPSYPPSIHQLRTDTKAPASPPAILRHDLFHDPAETSVQRSNHDLGLDQVSTYGGSRSNHDLGHDQVSTYRGSRSNHDLGFDQVNTYRASPEHQIHHDETVPGAFPTSSHGLGDDLTSTQTTAQPHGLGQDPTSTQAAVQSHGLGEDNKIMDIKSYAAHHLYEDK
ncbi:integral membrane [Fusarium longipes]|uniref:Integral membrane n=1 Tax=Fusarium longipes TaxID=694270 RepID=A0A395SHY1_9HYPO|nr:integral membrane [Fusarium longipes]